MRSCRMPSVQPSSLASPPMRRSPKANASGENSGACGRTSPRPSAAMARASSMMSRCPSTGSRRSSRRPYEDLAKRAIHDLVRAHGGSFSAEHGIGRLKVDELQRYASPVELGLMRAIKQAFDPNGIMNPGKVLPRSACAD